MFSYILFDLDGTISDPKVGITGSVQYALKSFGIEEPDADRLEPFIGPPLRDSFMKYYNFTQEQAEEAVGKYRERFSEVGKYENELYPGIPELLRDLKAAGAHLAVASSKPTVYVEDILNYFGIRQYFEIVVGSELDGRRERKEEVVREVLWQFAQRGAANPSSVVMVGDRKYDVEGARAAGAHSIGVAYGYAAPGELQEAGAEILVQNVEGLRSALLGGQPPVSVSARDQGSAAAGRQGTGQEPGGQGVYSGGSAADSGSLYRRYRGQNPARPETKASRVGKAVGACALAMLAYFLINLTVGTAVLLIGMLTSGFLPGGMSQSAYNYWINLGNAAGVIAAFVVCFLIWRRDVRLRPRVRTDGLSLVPMAVLAASLAAGLNGLLSLVELYRYSPTFQEVSQMQFDTPLWLGILSFGILAPLGEEFVFRGVVYGRLKKVSNVPLAVVVSGLLFGLFHGNLVQAVYATALGIVLAIVYEIYDSILAPMAFHAVANLFVYVMMDLMPFGGVFVTLPACVFFLLISAVSLVLMVKWQKGAA